MNANNTSAGGRAVIYASTARADSRQSIENQCNAVREYAMRHNTEIVRVYADVEKSGSSLDGRDAMKRLLADMTGPDRDFAVILVYDHSRWGPFADAGESAYCEHVCRRAGNPQSAPAICSTDHYFPSRPPDCVLDYYPVREGGVTRWVWLYGYG